MNSNPRKQVSYLPNLSFLRHYSSRKFRADLQAGATVGIFAVPQVMAYAMLAGVPPVYGLYTVVVVSTIAALWGWSPYLSSGPSNSAALLTAAAIAPFIGRGDLMDVVFVFGLMIGCFRLLLGVLRAGALIDYVSEAAMLGFTVGIGTLIAFGQLHHMLGVEPSTSQWFVVRVLDSLQQIASANPGAVGIAVGTWLAMVALNRFSRKFPVALTAILLATVAAELISGKVAVARVRDIAEVQAGLPSFTLHAIDWAVAWEMMPFAIAVAVIGLIEVATIAKVFAAKHDTLENENQEFIGQGIGQIVGSFFQGIPCSGSFTRSALLEHTGAKTRMASIYLTVCMSVALLLFARWLNYIPIAALAGLLFFIGFRLVNVAKLRHVWQTSGSDGAIMLITFLVTVFIHIEYGIFAGIAASGLLILRRVQRLQLYELVPQTGEFFEEVPYADEKLHSPGAMVALDIHGNLFYAQAPNLRDQLTRVIEQHGARYILLRMRRVYSLDYSCWSVLRDVGQALQDAGGGLILCDVQPELQPMFERAGMEHVVPPSQIFPSTGSQYGSLCEAARSVLAIDMPPAELAPAWQTFDLE